MNVSQKGQLRIHTAIANVIAMVDIDQEDRERLAHLMADALSEARSPLFDGFRKTFELIASDPLVPCAGPDGDGCPHGRMIRIAMHLSTAPDGRSAAWEQRAPYGRIRCVSCGFPTRLSA